MGLSWEVFALVALFAFLAEYVDSSLGMGYGTTLAPILLLVGFSSLQVVPVILLSEFVTGLVAAALHHTFSNVNFSKGSPDMKIALALCGCGFFGSLIAVLFAVSLSDQVLRIYIGSLVLIMGVLLLFLKLRQHKFSWVRLLCFGLLGSFNKGASGGGYGPLITAGQIFSGVNPKSAVGVTSLAEGVISLVAVITYSLAVKSVDWTLALPVLLGAVLSTPLAAYTVKRLQFTHLKNFIGLLAIVLGMITLIKALR